MAYNLGIKIGYMIIISVLIILLLGFYFSGLNSVKADVKKYNEDSYGSAAVLENLLTLDASRTELGEVSTEYDYDRRRAIIPVEYFTHEASGDEVGYKKRSGNCYIERVEGFDGVKYGFYISTMYQVTKNAENAREIDCMSPTLTDNRFSSPALLVRKARDNPPLPARLYIYEIE